MQAIDRLAEIEARFSDKILSVRVLDLDGETLRLILFLKDGSNLRVAEQWDGENLKRHSYYWLSSKNELKVGWDNAPHHTKISTFPHHKHVELQRNIQASDATTLEDIMRIIAT
ncbi:MAG: DUF6516 family protein [candidate division KSB1 bacterium]|nr:DUF6516 family protein [candidate division KSB1 bacterium]MDZ7319733.1 DUF6516 family protein [candidate division KSB1 bacterium]MDZ7340886.1 DUF6516 family protein [candidate division KSB1 bacterium]